jgi:hypothetical protein
MNITLPSVSVLNIFTSDLNWEVEIKQRLLNVTKERKIKRRTSASLALATDHCVHTHTTADQTCPLTGCRLPP